MNPDAYNSYIGDLRKGGIVIFDSSLFEVVNRFEGVTYLAIPATKLAQEIGAPQATNVIMLGAVAAVSKIIAIDSLRKAVTERFPKAVSLNLKALEAGYTLAKEIIQLRRNIN
jgi:2-oxoglutarate ferredoxin oxidoreductase subunit gamma